MKKKSAVAQIMRDWKYYTTFNVCNESTESTDKRFLWVISKIKVLVRMEKSSKSFNENKHLKKLS